MFTIIATNTINGLTRLQNEQSDNFLFVASLFFVFIVFNSFFNLGLIKETEF